MQADRVIFMSTDELAGGTPKFLCRQRGLLALKPTCPPGSCGTCCAGRRHLPPDLIDTDSRPCVAVLWLGRAQGPVPAG